MKKIIGSVVAVLVFSNLAFAGENYFHSVKSEYGAFASGLGVGVTESNPSYALDVAGAARITGVATIVGSPVITGSPAITGNLTLVGNQSVSGSKAEVPNTSYSAIAVSSAISPVGVNFLVINASGTLTSTATPFLSTTTAISGQSITIMGGAKVLTLQDNGTLSGSLLELGDTTRALGAGDILKLRYYSGKWYEEGFVNN